MLAQSFMSAADLGITEPQRDALQKVLVMLETEKLSHAPDITGIKSVFSDDRSMKLSGHFNMDSWVGRHSCGTVACIGGTAELVSGEAIFGGADNQQEWPFGLRGLFYPAPDEAWKATPSQAARALRSYLTTGDAKWAEAVA